MNAMYHPIEFPGVTSALAFDRVVVATCGRRVDDDYSAVPNGGEPVVFTELDWTQDAVDPDDPQLADQIQVLYRVLLGRDPDPAETAMLLTLAEPLDGLPITPREFAKTTCYAIATTTEMVMN